jgi:alpha-pyrone synthase
LRVVASSPTSSLVTNDTFVVFAEKMFADPRLRTVFHRMVSRANIAHRCSFLDPQKGSGQFSSHDAHEFYRLGNFPNTARRMELFEQSAPVLMRKAMDRLALNEKERSGITHVLVTCCTGFYAPGLDFEIIDHLGLSAGVERTMVGFMGCYAAINALKLARHIVRQGVATCRTGHGWGAPVFVKLGGVSFGLGCRLSELQILPLRSG